MTFTISVRGSEIAFDCEPEQNVLDAAETAGWAIPYSCRKGVCDTCVGGLSTGVLDVPGQGRVCGPAEVRLCRARPMSDVEIVPRRVEHRAPPVRKQLTSVVHRIRRPNDRVTILDLRYPIGRRTPFRAGQFVNIVLPDGDTRPYSMANPPQHNDALQLHIRTEPGGRFSDGILRELQFHDPVEIEAPFGDFVVADPADPARPAGDPVILLATGTGFAPMRSIVLDHIARRLDRPVHLYWGARTIDDLYLIDTVTAWARRYPWFRFTPVLSRPHAGWDGATGWVQEAVLADYPDLTEHHIYACGSEAMTVSAADVLARERDVAPDRFHADAFVSAAGAH
ncbi:2Fe-2S iron-sulfur cluster-binding protein [Saccharopolyspora hordei]|uniref:NAD(P)H-flavin reductase n=1 Tax=Saccharopolyspora hordei TaxID=1838 RepID=A0A853AJ75_9PSEU|nr:2Fe-2S iron-sulfur cluster-binding protein [Saccharopolyspora hordei]NYI84058.1 NAD(P)H-flavin reductase [Saccharopolyspora hordei]